MRIDAHQHFWSVSRGDYFWLKPELGPLYRDFGPADLQPLLAEHGIAATVLVQAAQTIAETRFMLGIAEKQSWVAGVVGWADFESATGADDIGMLAGHPKLVGIRPMIQDIQDDSWMLRPDLAPAFRAIAESGLVFDALVFPRHLRNLHKLSGRYPRLRMVIDHCAKPQIRDGQFEPWASDITSMARDSAAFCKLSGIVTEAGPDWSVEDLKPYVDHVLEQFGPERVVWGSDWPVATQAATYTDWLSAARSLTAGLSRHEQEAIFGGSAIRLYRLQEEGRLNGVESIAVAQHPSRR